MGKTTAKGELGEAMILADLQRQGHGVGRSGTWLNGWPAPTIGHPAGVAQW